MTEWPPLFLAEKKTFGGICLAAAGKFLQKSCEFVLYLKPFCKIKSIKFSFKVAQHSFGSLWVFVICQSWQEKGRSSQAVSFASEKYTDEIFWLMSKMWRFRSFHGNMSDWIQP